jgi:hypothetical protein
LFRYLSSLITLMTENDSEDFKKGWLPFRGHHPF